MRHDKHVGDRGSVVVHCPHAEVIENRVHCRKGRFGGMPSVGVCHSCLTHAPSVDEWRGTKSRPKANLPRWFYARLRLCILCKEPCILEGCSSCQRKARLKRPGFVCFRHDPWPMPDTEEGD